MPIYPPSTLASPTAPHANIPKFLAASEETINQNFAALEAHTATLLAQPGMTVTHPLIHHRDRYDDIKTYAHNQIALTSLEFSYINASPINLGRANETFIATQAPESSAFGAGLFWEMVHQEKSEVVIMLTPYFERGKERCGKYFPEEVDEVKDLGEWGSVKCVSRFTECGTVLRELKVMKGSEHEVKDVRTVYHFHFLAWPDHDVPKTDDILALLSLIKMSRFRIENLSNGCSLPSSGVLPPRIVHCSAGVGRTGTLIALDYLLKEFEDDKWDKLPDDVDPIFETVKKMRDQRMGLVYKPGQHAFLYKTLADKWTMKEGQRLAAMA